MMYPFLTLNDDTEITHSEMKEDGQVKAYCKSQQVDDSCCKLLQLHGSG